MATQSHIVVNATYALFRLQRMVIEKYRIFILMLVYKLFPTLPTVAINMFTFLEVPTLEHAT